MSDNEIYFTRNGFSEEKYIIDLWFEIANRLEKCSLSV